MHLVTVWHGSYLVDDQGVPQQQRSFQASADLLKKRWADLRAGRVLPEELQLLQSQAGRVRISEQRLAGEAGTLLTPEAPLLEMSPGRLGLYPGPERGEMHSLAGRRRANHGVGRLVFGDRFQRSGCQRHLLDTQPIKRQLRGGQLAAKIGQGLLTLARLHLQCFQFTRHMP